MPQCCGGVREDNVSQPSPRSVSTNNTLEKQGVVTDGTDKLGITMLREDIGARKKEAFTTLRIGAHARDTVLFVGTTLDWQMGDLLKIASSAPEMVQIKKIDGSDSISLQSPLQGPHAAGAKVHKEEKLIGQHTPLVPEAALGLPPLIDSPDGKYVPSGPPSSPTPFVAKLAGLNLSPPAWEGCSPYKHHDWEFHAPGSQMNPSLPVQDGMLHSPPRDNLKNVIAQPANFADFLKAQERHHGYMPVAEASLVRPVESDLPNPIGGVSPPNSKRLSSQPLLKPQSLSRPPSFSVATAATVPTATPVTSAGRIDSPHLQPASFAHKKCAGQINMNSCGAACDLPSMRIALQKPFDISRAIHPASTQVLSSPAPSAQSALSWSPRRCRASTTASNTVHSHDMIAARDSSTSRCEVARTPSLQTRQQQTAARMLRPGTSPTVAPRRRSASPVHIPGLRSRSVGRAATMTAPDEIAGLFPSTPPTRARSSSCKYLRTGPSRVSRSAGSTPRDKQRCVQSSPRTLASPRVQQYSLSPAPRAPSPVLRPIQAPLAPAVQVCAKTRSMNSRSPSNIAQVAGRISGLPLVEQHAALESNAKVVASSPAACHQIVGKICLMQPLSSMTPAQMPGTISTTPQNNVHMLASSSTPPMPRDPFSPRKARVIPLATKSICSNEQQACDGASASALRSTPPSSIVHSSSMLTPSYEYHVNSIVSEESGGLNWLARQASNDGTKLPCAHPPALRRHRPLSGSPRAQVLGVRRVANDSPDRSLGDEQILHSPRRPPPCLIPFSQPLAKHECLPAPQVARAVPVPGSISNNHIASKSFPGIPDTSLAAITQVAAAAAHTSNALRALPGSLRLVSGPASEASFLTPRFPQDSHCDHGADEDALEREIVEAANATEAAHARLRDALEKLQSRRTFQEQPR